MTDNDLAIHFQQTVLNLVGLTEEQWIQALVHHTKQLVEEYKLSNWKLLVEQEIAPTDTRIISLLATKESGKRIKVSGTIQIHHY